MKLTDADITVTTATQSEADVRERLGVPAEAAPPAAPAAPVLEDTTVEQTEAEADSPKTDAELSEAARILRGSRSRSEKKVLKEIALRKQAEERADRAEAALRTAQPPLTPPAPKADAAPAAADAAPTFAFPSFEKWQEQQKDDAPNDYEAYSDARTDARYAFNRQIEQHQADRERFQRAYVERGRIFAASETTFKTAHADYDDVLTQVVLPDTDATRPTKGGRPAPLHQLIHRDPTAAPAILYYLGQHPDVAEHLAHAPDPDALIFEFGKVVATVFATPPPAAAAPAASPAPPAASPPAQPVTDAPAPLSPVAGGASHIRSLAALAADGDDADAYIERRKLELKRTG
jgi:hypothetical protein